MNRKYDNHKKLTTIEYLTEKITRLEKENDDLRDMLLKHRHDMDERQGINNGTVKTLLDITLWSYKFPQEFSDILETKVREFFRHMQLKEGRKYGSKYTVMQVINNVLKYQQEYSDEEIIDSINFSMLRDYKSFNPQWLKSKTNRNENINSNFYNRAAKDIDDMFGSS